MAVLTAVLGLLVALKALDVLLVGPQLLGEVAGTSLGLGLLCAGSLVTLAPRLPRPGTTARVGWALALVVLSVMLAGPLYRNHVLFLWWVALIMLVTPWSRERRILLTSHLSVVYLFATLAKLNPTWLSGTSLEAWGARLVLIGPTTAAWLTVALELVLAVAVWRPARWSLLLAVGVHVAFVVGMAGGPFDVLRLTIFNAAAIALWVWLYAEMRTQSRAVSSHRSSVRTGTPVPWRGLW